ncbi:MAG: hypothetical protein AAF639_44960 [Chloroflexota bacterium]
MNGFYSQREQIRSPSQIRCSIYLNVSKNVFDYNLLMDCIYHVRVLADGDNPQPDAKRVLSMLGEERERRLVS